ncbi:MAG: hypothetical protein A2W90_00715 [Bacteroidetes bacterium GWF2_42_66]|nr:MAG: hypothetical protein A2W89_12115 [Bacteroidetes bacterium GWE2_42_39]OFY40430.1 MAG: hypothetical protein A2W90_00715 [Bacteroidetes bacterium GWF2_42_66]HCR90813.1 hypothetical protein [Prolixibacteraceae bacterium]HCU62670.1 hypothetical protein [Prolixibacteraceae bacterium]
MNWTKSGKLFSNNKYKRKNIDSYKEKIPPGNYRAGLAYTNYPFKTYPPKLCALNFFLFFHIVKLGKMYQFSIFFF